MPVSAVMPVDAAVPEQSPGIVFHILRMAVDFALNRAAGHVQPSRDCAGLHSPLEAGGDGQSLFLLQMSHDISLDLVFLRQSAGTDLPTMRAGVSERRYHVAQDGTCKTKRIFQPPPGAARERRPLRGTAQCPNTFLRELFQEKACRTKCTSLNLQR